LATPVAMTGARALGLIALQMYEKARAGRVHCVLD
jgi:hypothetical protein